MANPTVIGNNQNAFVAPSGGFPFANASAVIEVNNGDSATLVPGACVNIYGSSDSLASPPWPATTHPAITGPVYVFRSPTTATVMTLGIVVGEAVPPYQTWQAGINAGTGAVQAQQNQKLPGLATVCVQGVCSANVDGTTNITTKVPVSTGTATQGTVMALAAAGASVGLYIGVGIVAPAAAGGVGLIYVSKF